VPTVITAFERPPDGSNIAQHRAGGVPECLVYRSIDDTASFGLIAVCPRVNRAASDALAGAVGLRPAFSGVYREHDIGGGVVGPSHDTSAVVTFVNCLRVDSGREDEAYATWKRVNDYMVAKPGYLSHVLYRRMRPDTPFAFINVVRWTSAESLRAAQDEPFRKLIRNLPFVPHPSLCRHVCERNPVGAR
jgi:heme-degrading monooxygenase HmoA